MMVGAVVKPFWEISPFRDMLALKDEHMRSYTIVERAISMPTTRLGLLGLLAASLGIFHVQAQPGEPSRTGESSRSRQDCFFVDQLQSWRAPDPSTIYIRVRPDRYYRLDLAGQCTKLQWPGSHLITNSHGKSTICSPLDWDLRVSELTEGAPEQCVVHSMTRLDPAQVAAIPKPFKP
jgi:hypothetical protein